MPNSQTAYPTGLYEALSEENCIRLLRLNSGKSGEPLVCQLSTHRLSTAECQRGTSVLTSTSPFNSSCPHADPDDQRVEHNGVEKIEQLSGTLCNIEAPSYEAVSYVWGNPTITSEIVCNGQPLTVTANLAKLLDRMRLASQPRMLWADAICIDQSNLDERAAQVGIMGSIYEHADRVLVWLGEDPNNEARLAFELIEAFVRYKTYEQDYWLPQWLLPHAKPSSWEAIRSLLRREWFSRVWVLLEVGLARSVEAVWGSLSIQFSPFIEFMEHIRDLNFFATDTVLQGSTRLRDTFLTLWCTFGRQDSWIEDWPLIKAISRMKSTRKCNFIDVLALGTEFEASESRDKIYALLSHPSASDTSGPRGRIVDIDYKKDLSEVYWDLFAKVIVSSKRLNILSLISYTSEAELDASPVSGFGIC